MHRDQPGNGCQPGGHCEHPAVSADAQVLEGEALGVEATGRVPVRFFFSFLSSFYVIVSLDHFHKCKLRILCSAELT